MVTVILMTLLLGFKLTRLCELPFYILSSSLSYMIPFTDMLASYILFSDFFSQVRNFNWNTQNIFVLGFCCYSC